MWAPVMLSLGNVENPLLPSLPGPLWPEQVTPDRSYLWLNRTKSYIYLNELLKKRLLFYFNLIPMLNWIVWNEPFWHSNCLLMLSWLANFQETWVQSQVGHTKTLKMVLIPPSLTLSNVRYIQGKVKQSRKGVASSLTPQYSTFEREPSGHLRLKGDNFTFYIINEFALNKL